MTLTIKLKPEVVLLVVGQAASCSLSVEGFFGSVLKIVRMAGKAC
jgi:hypothetical protein